MMSNLTKLIGIKHLTTPVYKPECIGLIELMNFTLSQAIKSYVSIDHKDWDKLVPYITFCINTSKQETTKLSPFELLYGRPAILPQDLVLSFDGFESIDSCNEYVRQVHSWLNKAREIAKNRVSSTYIKESNRFNGKRIHLRFNVGDFVYLWSPPSQHHVVGRSARKPNLTTKLLYSWHGPWNVVRKVSNVNYEIERKINKKSC